MRYRSLRDLDLDPRARTALLFVSAVATIALLAVSGFSPVAVGLAFCAWVGGVAALNS